MAESDELEKARFLRIFLYQYSSDHDGHYPEGKSSTEVFQKLLDQGYLVDSEGGNAFDILYIPIPGKVRAARETKILKPENVCWDVTCCLDSHSPDSLPLLFFTGYKVTYQAGTSAVPLPHSPLSWWDWADGEHSTNYIVAGSMSLDCYAIKAAPDGTIPKFIPASFRPGGKIYRQLTPEGVLSR